MSYYGEINFTFVEKRVIGLMVKFSLRKWTRIFVFLERGRWWFLRNYGDEGFKEFFIEINANDFNVLPYEKKSIN